MTGTERMTLDREIHAGMARIHMAEVYGTDAAGYSAEIESCGRGAGDTVVCLGDVVLSSCEPISLWVITGIGEDIYPAKRPEWPPPLVRRVQVRCLYTFPTWNRAMASLRRLVPDKTPDVTSRP